MCVGACTCDCTPLLKRPASNDDPEFIKALKLASHSYNELEHLQDPSSCPPKKSRRAGAGCKVKAPEVRVALFHWFINMQESLKGCLPHHLFKLKALKLYEDWLVQNPVPEKNQLKFSNKWIRYGRLNMV